MVVYKVFKNLKTKNDNLVLQLKRRKKHSTCSDVVTKLKFIQNIEQTDDNTRDQSMKSIASEDVFMTKINKSYMMERC